MVNGKRTTVLSLMVFSLIIMIGGCSSWLTPPPVSPSLEPLVSKAAPAEKTTLPESLVLGVAWLTPSGDAIALPQRRTNQIFDQFREHFSEPGNSLQVTRVDTVTSLDLPTLRKLGQQQDVTHMLVVAPTVQEITVPEKFGAPRGNWVGTRTTSQVFLEAVAIELKSGLPIFEAQGNGQAALEALDYGAFGPYPRIFRGFYPPGDGGVFYPEGAREEFPPGEVRVFASNYALAGLLEKLDLVKTTKQS